MFLTGEFSSELASFDLDPDTGALKLIDKQTTIAGFKGRNEPATLQVHRTMLAMDVNSITKNIFCREGIVLRRRSGACVYSGEFYNNPVAPVWNLRGAGAAIFHR
jgi:hypothetical protein